jgi:hypothetical protein
MITDAAAFYLLLRLLPELFWPLTATMRRLAKSNSSLDWRAISNEEVLPDTFLRIQLTPN